jgi:hypothetical protein
VDDSVGTDFSDREKREFSDREKREFSDRERGDEPWPRSAGTREGPWGCQ